MDTEPTQTDVIAAIKRRTGCAHASVFSWHDDDGRRRYEAHATDDDWPDEGTYWHVLAVAGSLGELLRFVERQSKQQAMLTPPARRGPPRGSSVP